MKSDPSTNDRPAPDQTDDTAPARDADAPEQAEQAAPDEGPIVVGIGASAGGLAALKAFFAAVPEDSGMAWVVVVHLSPEHESHLAELLQPHVKMPVQQVTQTMKLEPGCVYVIPPNANLSAVDTHLRLSELEERRRNRAPIDHFFRTLSKTHDGHAIGVILTGTGSDGTLGLREIKQRAGLTVVQDPNEAQYDGMPQSAIATGLVDLILPIAEIPEAILRFAGTEPKVPVPADGEEPEGDERMLLQKVFAQIRARTGRDFSRYKHSTILRRITRRMQLAYIEELQAYLEMLREEPDEVRALADDLLIIVTNFFRDEEVFEHLEREVIPALFEGKDPDDTVRVWSVGCATGEEAYSLAILLLEEAARLGGAAPRLQVFASDLHERSLERARDGFYPGDIEADVSAERLERFFHKEDGGFRVRKEVRELVVFAPHNLLGDPPFSKLDLIACRNVLIYLQRDVQTEVAALFHYALRPDGFLVLGTSETVDSGDLFRVEDKAYCVYRKRNVPAPEPRLPVFPMTRTQIAERRARGETDPTQPPAYGALHQRMVETFAPPSLLVSPDDKVVHLSEHAGRYLVHPGGEPTTNAYKLVREELRIDLRATLHTARERREPVRSKAVPVRFNGESASVVLDVRPSPDPSQEGFALVIFDERALPDASATPEADAAAPDDTARTRELEAELDLARQRLQTIIEEYETSQEEMKASNEELQSANEELRSTMEELETSKEELQSMNEELQTVNQENRLKVEELAQLSGDLQNLMASTDIATLFLDRELRILRFTPRIGELFNVRPVDRGRPLTDITHRLGYPEIEADAARVLRSFEPIEREVKDESGRWYLTRILPYRSTDDRVEGIVLTFVDVTARKEAEEEVRRAKETAEGIIDTLHEPLLVLTPDLRVHSANPTFYEHFEVDPVDTEGRRIYDLGNGQWAIPELRRLLEDILPENETFDDYEVAHDFEEIGERVMLLNARRLDSSELILLGVRDITERKRAEEAVRESEERYRSYLINSLLIFARVDTDLRYVDIFNPHTDFDPDAVVGKRDDELDEGPGVDALMALKRHVLESGEQERREITFERSDGARTYDITATPVRDEQGELQGLVTAALDVTEHRQAEEALRESEARLQEAIAIPTVGVIFWDADFRIGQVNDAFLRMTGFDREEAIGKTWQELTPEAFHPASERTVASVQATGAAPPYEKPYYRKDGSLFWGLFASRRLGEDEAVEFVLDVTERKRTEEALRESEERYRLLVESAEEYAILMLDDDGRIVSWNRGAERIFGYTEEEAQGQPGSVLFTPADREAGVPEQEMVKAAREGQADDDCWHVRKDGERFWASGVMTALRDRDGALRGFVKVLRDNTERKRTEEQLRWLNETLEARVHERSERVRELASTLAMAEQDERRRIAQVLHDDLQQLLFGIQLKMTFVRKDAEAADAPALAEHAAESERYLDRAIQVSRELTVDLSPPVLSGEGLTQTLEWLTTQMREVHHLTVEIDAEDAFVIPQEGMRVLLFQIVRELLFNVVKHADTDRAVVSLDKADDGLIITVTDEGAGFDPSTLKPKAEGGFGLFSVRERLGLFGGSLEVESAPGEGTRMIARIPGILAPPSES